MSDTNQAVQSQRQARRYKISCAVTGMHGSLFLRYETRPCNIRRFLTPLKTEKFIVKMIFLISMLKTMIVGTRQNCLVEYPQSMFWIKNKKIRYMYTPVYPQFYYIKVGLRRYIFHGHVFLMWIYADTV